LLPYGGFTVLNPDWSLDADGTDFGWFWLHQGLRYDPATGLYHGRHRELSSSLGRWMQQDPLGYPDGMNRYEGSVSNPLTFLDPSGLKIVLNARGFDEEPAKRYADEILEALQAVVGDCAQLVLKPNVPRGKIKPRRQNIREWVITFENEKPDCKCGCWAAIKSALDLPKTVTVRPTPDDRIYEPQFKDGYAEISPGPQPQSPGANGGMVPTPLGVVIVHEAVGHGVLGYEHPYFPDNIATKRPPGSRYVDPTVDLENMARKCLRDNGTYPKLQNRSPAYYPGLTGKEYEDNP
jgi:RHS repeat-associated protein